jgi:hypothetical protein
VNAASPAAWGVGDDGMVNLWRKMLLQALSDAECRRTGTVSCPEHEVLSARRWLTRTNAWSFHTVLAAADLDAGWWRTRVVPVLLARWEALDAGHATRRRTQRAVRRPLTRISAPGR